MMMTSTVKKSGYSATTVDGGRVYMLRVQAFMDVRLTRSFVRNAQTTEARESTQTDDKNGSTPVLAPFLLCFAFVKLVKPLSD